MRGNMEKRESEMLIFSISWDEFPYLYTTRMIKIEITKIEIQMFYDTCSYIRKTGVGFRNRKP
jgi:hypothetical protein